jgi:predicted kinase
MKLVLTRGLPASGKTTFARNWVAEDPGMRTRVNRDDLRAMMFGGWTGKPDHEDAVTCAQRGAVAHLITVGWSVVVDDTNLNPLHLDALRRLGERMDAEVEVVDLTDVPPQECERRDALRGDKAVGATVIWNMFERWLKPTGGAT